MKKVLHISTECYPAAKSGGLGDVVGALPVYQEKFDIEASVIIPKYNLPWFQKQNFTTEFSGHIQLAEYGYNFEVQKLKDGVLPYPLYCIDIPNLFDRPSIYLDEHGKGYQDEPQRNIAFQRTILQWLVKCNKDFDLLHCHDHQSGLIPFFTKFVPKFSSLSWIPTIFTIHNAQYRGIFQWYFQKYLPAYDWQHNGWLDWDHCINSLAAAVKVADIVTTVSPNYMAEISMYSGNLETLFRSEQQKCTGIINGIDTEVWDPKTDKYLDHKRTHHWQTFKNKNKKSLCEEFNLDPKLPLISFIGRLANEKGADFLGESIYHACKMQSNASFILLGSGDKEIENDLLTLQSYFPDRVASIIKYDEGLAHKIYAGSDFLMMPSRFEPCGLNQMYAMHYGTIPIVRSTGGLKDTVPDISEDGNGIAYLESSAGALTHSIMRALELYSNKEQFKKLRKKVIAIDFSWEKSAQKYFDLYHQILEKQLQT
ncbi:MAG: glycogen synthase [Chitinophagales bacterium]|nr:glycogen synthase [Chitinophagales bacterium]